MNFLSSKVTATFHHNSSGLGGHIDSIKKAGKEINRREKALQAYLEGRKLTQDEIDRATDPDAAAF